MMFSTLFNFKRYQPISGLDFHQLAARNAVADVRYHLENGFDASCVINAGVTPLMTASLYNATEVISVLLQHGANVNQQTDSGWTALLYAAKAGHLETVRLLLTHGADVNLCLKGGENAFIEACSAQQVEVAHLLLEKGADVNTLHNAIGLNGLLVAANFGDLGLVQATLAKTDNINHQNVYGETALMRAAMQGHSEVVAYLLDMGADKTILDSFGNDALFYANKFSHDGVIGVLG